MFVAPRTRMIASSSSPSPCPPSALSIAGRAGRAFTPHAMMQGFTCHARGVELAASTPGRPHARVRSKRLHDVLLRVDDGRLGGPCTCPARSFGLDVCKHAWAALLEVDRQDGLSDLRKTRGPLVVVAAPLPTATESADATATLEGGMTASRARSKKPAASTTAKKKAPAETAPGGNKATTASKKKASSETASAPRGSETSASKKNADAETTRASATTKARPQKPAPAPTRRSKRR